MFRWLRREPKPIAERRQALSHALLDYPLYQPPHRQGSNSLRRRDDLSEQAYADYIHEYIARSDENFLFFLEQRPARVAALQAFLGKFGGSASLDDAGLASVSKWLPDNGYALANLRDEAVRQTFYQMQVPWIEELRGLNVIFDLGIFFGECLIKKQPRLYWKYLHGASDHGESNGTGYHIDGFRGKGKGDWLDPGGRILGLCHNDLNELYFYGPVGPKNYDSLVGIVRDFAKR